MFGSIMKPFLLILLLIATPFIFRLGARGAIGFADNYAYETVTGHSMLSTPNDESRLSNKQKYERAVREAKLNCRIYGKIWCDRYSKKYIAEAKRYFLDQNKHLYELAVKQEKEMCQDYGKDWCDKYYKKDIAVARKEFLSNQ